MGQSEVIEYMVMLRESGDDMYYKSPEIHEQMKARGISISYISVWRSLNALWWHDEVEVTFDVKRVQRTAKFRAVAPTSLHTSQVKRVHNIPLEIEENRLWDKTRREEKKKSGVGQVHGRL